MEVAGLGFKPCTKREQKKLACYAEPKQSHDQRELPFGLHPLAVFVGSLACVFLEELDKMRGIADIKFLTDGFNHFVR